MKKLLFLALLVSAHSFATVTLVRYDAPFPSISPLTPPYLVANVPPNAPLLAVCNSPANTVPCTNYATTYMQNGTACPNGAQDTPQPNATTSACQSTGDAWGNVGFWIPAGTYDYTVCIQNNCFGPYTITLGGGAGGGTLTGITTASGSGLEGGGTSGTLNLAMTPCTTPDPYAFWNSSTGWGCAASSGSSVPGGSPFNVQVNNNNTSFAGITNVALGPPLVSAGVNSYPVYATGVSYATSAANWTRNLVTPLTGGSPATLTLIPCPLGVDAATGLYEIYISDGSAEVVTVTGGSCTSGASSGTIIFTPHFSHSLYTLESASSGIQETVNIGCGVSTSPTSNGYCNVIIPASETSGGIYAVPGTIFLHGSQLVLSGYGASLACTGRGPCIQVGDLTNSNHAINNTIQGINFRTNVDYSSNPSYAGLVITNTVTAAGVQTITTSSAHGFRVGDMVTILFTDNSVYWGDCVIGTVPSTTTFTCPGAGNVGSQTTPGLVALTYVAVLDNGFGTHLTDINYDYGGATGHFNNFFDFWDDENATVDHFNNNAIDLNRGQNWSGAYIFSAGAHVSQQIAPVITLQNSSITANTSSCGTVYNSNGLYVDNTVCQSTGLWEFYVANIKGNFQGAALRNIYNNGSNAGLNPSSPVYTPFPGLGGAGLIAGQSTGAADFTIEGSGGVTGYFPTGGTGTTPYSYYIVANDTTAGTQTSPMQILNWESTGSDSIPVKWPRIANGTDTITYDVIRMTTAVNIGDVYPGYACSGGSAGACGSVATAISQSSACSGGLICTYTDTGSSTTSSYAIQFGTYAGLINFWPGAVVAEGNSETPSIHVDYAQGPMVGIGMHGNPIEVADNCSNFGQTSAGGFSSCLASITAPPGNGVPNQTATLLTDGPAPPSGNTQTDSKGRLNFPQPPGVEFAAHDIVTLLDSQPALTQSTIGYRPLASVNDVAIGTDTPMGSSSTTNGQLSFRAPVYISSYIAAVNDNTSWLERLSASLKEIKVALKLDSTLTITSLANGCLNIASGLVGTTGGGCGTAAAGSQYAIQYAGAAGAFSGITPPTVNGSYLCGYLVAGGVAVAPTCQLPGVAVDDTNPSTLLYSDRASFLNWTGGSALALPAAATNFASNFPFVLKNTAGSTLTITPTSPNTIDGAGTGTVLNNWASFIYQNATPNWETIKIPTLSAFTDTSAGNLAVTFTASTGQFGTISTLPTFPITVSGGTSGAIPCFTATTTESVSSLLNQNQPVNGGGTGVCPKTGFVPGIAGTITLANLACYTASGTVGNCSATSPTNFIGVFNTTSTWISSGEVLVNFDSSSTTTYGDFICSSSTSAGTAHENGSTPCSAGRNVGIAKGTNGSPVSSATIFVKMF